MSSVLRANFLDKIDADIKCTIFDFQSNNYYSITKSKIVVNNFRLH